MQLHILPCVSVTNIVLLLKTNKTGAAILPRLLYHVLQFWEVSTKNKNPFYRAATVKGICLLFSAVL